MEEFLTDLIVLFLLHLSFIILSLIHIWVTNNRCEKGEIIGDPRNDEVGKQLKETIRKTQSVPDLFQERKKLLFKEYPYPVPKTERDITIGIPRVLSYWDTMPFWTTFFKSLGYKVQLSDESTREIYESGLSAVTLSLIHIS